MAKNKVIKHLKGDIKTFKKEAAEDRKLISELKHKKAKKKSAKKMPMKKKPQSKKIAKKKTKIEKVMREYKEGKLHSGSKKGPRVTNRKQAVAIALSEARKNKKKK
jgi:uncharacterized protein DUF6496